MTARSITRQIPTIATMGNAAAGLAGCGMALGGRPELGALMILGAVLLDAIDGALARSLNATSAMGAELDSMSDLTSFGIAPVIIAGVLLPAEARVVGWMLLMVYPLCAAWRLARFNAAHDDPESDHEGFDGLPSTGAGAAGATALLLLMHLADRGVVMGDLLLPCLMTVLGVLMVSRLPYQHAAGVIMRMPPRVVMGLAVVFVAGSVLWQYQILFAGLMWTYVLSGPIRLAVARASAVRHA